MKARLVLAMGAALLGCLAMAPSASAAFHFMKVREVFAGGGNGNADFVELQMYAPGQTLLNGHEITVYNATGSGTDFPLVGDVSDGDNQRTILIGDIQVDTALGVNPDYEFDDLDVDAFVSAGAVCFPDADPAGDCVAWGNFGELGSFPEPSAATTEIPGGIAGANSATRKISPGCATLLQASDDTGSSSGDFELVPPTPRANSTAPTELPCVPGGGGAPPIKCGGKNATKTGTNGANVIRGTAGVDVIAALGGNDTVRGLAGNDFLCGGGGRDTLIGGGGRDKLFGQAGRDTCKGGPKKDTAKTCETKRTI